MSLCLAIYALGAIATYVIRRVATDHVFAAAHLAFTAAGVPRGNLVRIRRRLNLSLVVVSVVWPAAWAVRLVSEIVWKLASPEQQEAMRRWFRPKSRRLSG